MIRKIIQFAAFFAGNHNFHTTIYQGKAKSFCFPGLQCYVCPLSNTACPMGSFQHFVAMKYTDNALQRIPFYVIGFIGIIGITVGRLACGFLCPFGLFQELLYKIKTHKIRLMKGFSYIKYIVLVVVAIIIVWKTGEPWFCKLCPSGLLSGGIPQLLFDKDLRPLVGWLFYMKYAIALLVVIGVIFIKRMFCRVLCPLGAIWGLFNKISFMRLSVDKDKCIRCGMCYKVCPTEINISDSLDNPGVANSLDCVRCLSCKSICPMNAVKVTGIGARTADNVLPQQPPIPSQEPVPLH